MATLLAGTAAAGTAATVASSTAAAATTATTLSTVLTVLQGGAAIATIIGGLGAASAEADALMQSATHADLEAGQEHVRAVQRQTVMKRELLRVLGENDVSIAASGISLDGGVAESSRRKAVNAATRELSIERDDDDLRRALIKARANGLRTKASGARQAGLLRAVETGANFAVDVAERG